MASSKAFSRTLQGLTCCGSFVGSCSCGHGIRSALPPPLSPPPPLVLLAGAVGDSAVRLRHRKVRPDDAFTKTGSEQTQGNTHTKRTVVLQCQIAAEEGEIGRAIAVAGVGPRAEPKLPGPPAGWLIDVHDASLGVCPGSIWGAGPVPDPGACV